MRRPRLAMMTEAASDVRDHVRRARARRRARQAPSSHEQASADEAKRRLDETRTRLRSEIPPRTD